MNTTTELKTLGPYRILRRIGAGGMGEVFLAERLGSGGFRRQCCIKTVLPQFADRPLVRDLFEREAILAARVSHENIVNVFDYGADAGRLYIAMEYVDGINARRLLQTFQRERLSVEHVVSIMLDVTRGLRAVHAVKNSDGKSAGTVHRDVTPDNMLLTRDGMAKLGDFGIARAEDSLSFTATGDLRGKLRYMAPEQIEGGAARQASDIFSLGVSFYQLLTGLRPFDRSTELATMNAIVGEHATPVTVHNPQVPEAVCRIVEACLHKQHAQRPNAEALEALLLDAPVLPKRPAAAVARVVEQTQIAKRRLTTSLDPISLQSEAFTDASKERTPFYAQPTQVAWRQPTTAPAMRQPPAPRWRVAALGSLTVLALLTGLTALEPHKSAQAQTPRAAAPLAPVTLPPATTNAPVRIEAAPRSVERSTPESAPAAAAPPQPRTNKAAATIRLEAPSHIVWRGVDRVALGRGNKTVAAGLAGKRVIAVDPSTGAQSEVAIDNGVARYAALGEGTLEVRASPYAHVTLGQRTLGPTPLTPAPALVEGKYVVKLEYEGHVRELPVHIRAGERTVLRVRMESP